MLHARLRQNAVRKSQAVHMGKHRDNTYTAKTDEGYSILRAVNRRSRCPRGEDGSNQDNASSSRRSAWKTQWSARFSRCGRRSRGPWPTGRTRGHPIPLLVLCWSSKSVWCSLVFILFSQLGRLTIPVGCQINEWYIGLGLGGHIYDTVVSQLQC